jgi:hypothetical protein
MSMPNDFCDYIQKLEKRVEDCQKKTVFRNFKMVKSNPGSEGDCPIDWGWIPNPNNVFVYPPITRTEIQPNKNIHAVDLNGYAGPALLIAFE